MICQQLDRKKFVRARIFFNEGNQSYGWTPVGKDVEGEDIFVGTVGDVIVKMKELNGRLGKWPRLR